MDRQLLDKLAGYLSAKTEPTKQEKELLTRLKEAMTDFDIAFINRATIERNGFVANNLSDEDMEDLARKVGDCFCSSQQFDYAIEQACREMELEPILDCPLCGDSATYDPQTQTYTCNSCGQTWRQEMYVLVEDPEKTDRLPDDMGYPCANMDNSNARYIPEYNYLRLFKQAPDANSYFSAVQWPESQKYMPDEDSNDSILALNELINDEKGLEDFGANAVWVPLCNLE
ncbi:hypothetical protein [Alistipes indistinctus]|uniref:hypothetical protein n=1 Tax=Alistipes indistinctus TaxID=626932 RepID=UPI003A88D5C3